MITVPFGLWKIVWSTHPSDFNISQQGRFSRRRLYFNRSRRKITTGGIVFLRFVSSNRIKTGGGIISWLRNRIKSSGAPCLKRHTSLDPIYDLSRWPKMFKCILDDLHGIHNYVHALQNQQEHQFQETTSFLWVA